MEEHLCCYQFLAIMNKADINIYSMCKFWVSITLHFSGINTQECQCSSICQLTFGIFRNCKYVFQSGWLCHFTFQPAMYVSADFPTSLPAFDVFTFKKMLSHSDRCLVIMHCGFNFYFPLANNFDDPFVHLIAI